MHAACRSTSPQLQTPGRLMVPTGSSGCSVMSRLQVQTPAALRGAHASVLCRVHCHVRHHEHAHEICPDAPLNKRTHHVAIFASTHVLSMPQWALSWLRLTRSCSRATSVLHHEHAMHHVLLHIRHATATQASLTLSQTLASYHTTHSGSTSRT